MQWASAESPTKRGELAYVGKQGLQGNSMGQTWDIGRENPCTSMWGHRVKGEGKKVQDLACHLTAESKGWRIGLQGL